MWIAEQLQVLLYASLTDWFYITVVESVYCAILTDSLYRADYVLFFKTYVFACEVKTTIQPSLIGDLSINYTVSSSNVKAILFLFLHFSNPTRIWFYCFSAHRLMVNSYWLNRNVQNKDWIRGYDAVYVVGYKRFWSEIQKPRQMENAVRGR